jgi:hypothetical protein
MTLGDLSEDDVEGIRTGTIADPAVGQVAALAGAFGIEPAYLLDRGEAPLDGGLWRPCGRDGPACDPGDLAPVRAGEAAGAGDRAAVRGQGAGGLESGRT